MPDYLIPIIVLGLVAIISLGLGLAGFVVSLVEDLFYIPWGYEEPVLMGVGLTVFALYASLILYIASLF